MINNPILFGQVKRKLNITWDDDETSSRITEIIESAIPDLIHRLGITDPDFDFTAHGEELGLFKNYCLYEWNHSLNEFFDNYADSIAQIRAKNEVKHFEQEQVQPVQ
ncbi:MAG: hypothetical protein PUB43_02575 [Oscillospiraceae bacterium]|nr:hypothetical protein [Oscillospiraceae bacterium]